MAYKDNKPLLKKSDGTHEEWRSDDHGRGLVSATSEDVLECGVATGGTVNTLIDTVQGWQVNIFEDTMVEVEIGGVHYTREIDSNTADTLDFTTNPLPFAPIAGSPYCIKRVPKVGEVHIDPYTDNTGANILPAAVRSTAIGSFTGTKVQIHWAAPTSNPVTIALDANAGPAYDTVLRVIPMGAVSDLIYYFPESAKFEAGDAITVAWTNDIGALAWAVQIGWEE